VKPRALALLLLASISIVGIARQLETGARAMAASDEALGLGDVRSAIADARTAAEAVLPGSPYPRRGIERLAQLGKDAEARGDGAVAAAAWGAMRAAVLETRSLGGGHDAWLGEADLGLARATALGTSADAPATSSAPPTPTDRTGPSSFELLVLGAIPFALYAAASRFLRARR
jgi:hypothetical protein